MKNEVLIIILFVAVFSFSCNKEEDIPSYSEGKGRITGTTSTGYTFDVENVNAIFAKQRANGFNGDKTDNLLIFSPIDQALGTSIQLEVARFTGQEGEYRFITAQYLPPGETEMDNASFTLQNAPQITYTLSSSAGEYSRINFTRIKGNYIEGTYVIRLGTDPYSTPLLRIEGTFRGNFRNQ
jgi:hypothetical protein